MLEGSDVPTIRGTSERYHMSLVSTLGVDVFSNNVLIKNCIVDCEQGVSDVR